jgi:hypothetical protein
VSQEYTRKLEDVIKQMLRPLKGIPLNLVVESISGHKVIPFDKNGKKDRQLLKNLSIAASIAGKELNRAGIKRPRPNEVGNDIEPFVGNALRKIGYKADTPLTLKGKKKTTGYPDIEFVDEFKKTNY